MLDGQWQRVPSDGSVCDSEHEKRIKKLLKNLSSFRGVMLQIILHSVRKVEKNEGMGVKEEGTQRHQRKTEKKTRKKVITLLSAIENNSFF